LAVELPTVIRPVPFDAPMVIVPAAPVDGMMVGIAREVPVAFWKFKKLIVPVVAVKVLMLARLETFKFVVVAPIPRTANPPTILVWTPVAPIETVPVAPPVPIATVVVPGPVAMLTVEDVPIPKLSV